MVFACSVLLTSNCNMGFLEIKGDHEISVKYYNKNLPVNETVF